MICPVNSMRNGQWGKLVQIDGGDDLTEKLASLGIRAGTRLGKKYGLLGRGPVVLTIGTGEVAIGYGMATRMMVQVESMGEEGCKHEHMRRGRHKGHRLGLFMSRRGRRGHTQ